MVSNNNDPNVDLFKPLNREQLKKLQELIGSVQYGTVTLIIQGGKVIQFDKNEKIRLK